MPGLHRVLNMSKNTSVIPEYLITPAYVCTAQKMKLSVKDFFSKCDQIRKKLPNIPKYV